MNECDLHQYSYHENLWSTLKHFVITLCFLFVSSCFLNKHACTGMDKQERTKDYVMCHMLYDT
jgi:hypothetical protein